MWKGPRTDLSCASVPAIWNEAEIKTPHHDYQQRLGVGLRECFRGDAPCRGLNQEPYLAGSERENANRTHSEPQAAQLSQSSILDQDCHISTTPLCQGVLAVRAEAPSKHRVYGGVETGLLHCRPLQGSRTWPWPLYHAAASALTVAGLTLQFRRYQGQGGKDKKIPTIVVGTPEVQSHDVGYAACTPRSHVAPTVDETGCGQH